MLGMILMALGALVWLAGELLGFTVTGDTTSHFVKLFARSKWWHRALIMVIGELLIAHLSGFLW